MAYHVTVPRSGHEIFAAAAIAFVRSPVTGPLLLSSKVTVNNSIALCRSTWPLARLVGKGPPIHNVGAKGMTEPHVLTALSQGEDALLAAELV
jgi:hypothetical protein